MTIQGLRAKMEDFGQNRMTIPGKPQKGIALGIVVEKLRAKMRHRGCELILGPATGKKRFFFECVSRGCVCATVCVLLCVRGLRLTWIPLNPQICDFKSANPFSISLIL